MALRRKLNTAVLTALPNFTLILGSELHGWLFAYLPKADQVIHWEVVFLSNSAKWEVPFVYGAYCGFKRQEPCGTTQGDVYILNSASKQVQTVVRKAHLGFVTALSFLHDLRALASVSLDSSAKALAASSSSCSSAAISSVHLPRLVGDSNLFGFLVGFDDELPDSLVAELPDGKILEVGIEYPWKPENVCIAKRLVTYPNSVLLNLPRLGFPRIRIRLGMVMIRGGLQEQVSVLRKDDFSALQDKANISEFVGGTVNDVVPVPLDTGIKDPNVAPVVSPNPRQGNRRVTRAQVAAGQKAEGCEEGAPGQFTLLEFLDAAIEKGAKLKPIKTVKAKEKGKIVLNPVNTPMNAGPEPFNFFNFLTANDHFLEIIKELEVNFYQQLLGTSSSISDLAQIMQKTHPEQLRMELQQEVTDREIQDTLFFMDGGNIVTWDTKTWKRIGSKTVVRDTILAFIVSPDGKLLPCGTTQGDVFILNSASKQVQTVVGKAHLGFLTALSFSHDSRGLASVSLDSSARVTLIEENKKTGPNCAELSPLQPLGPDRVESSPLQPDHVVWSPPRPPRTNHVKLSPTRPDRVELSPP
nr:sec12-like protein 2 [Quercus suber]